MQGRGCQSLALLTCLVAACSAPTGEESHATPPAVWDVGGPVPLTPAQMLRFQRGALLFDSIYTPETGLGPLFNANSCVSCHHDPVPGGSGAETGLRATAFHEGVCDDLTSVGGPVVQLGVTPALHAALGIDQEPIPPGATGTGLRTTPSIWGSGLLDAVPDTEILAFADPDDSDGDGVSGRPNWTAEGRLGRFGRKAQVGTLWDFEAEAYLMEMGITDPLYPVEETVAGQPLPLGVDVTPDTELARTDLQFEDSFNRWLAPPAPISSPTIQAEGRATLDRIGCAACHRLELRTQANPAQSLNHQVIYAYTDLLLHDMGPNLADICMGQALPSEFRTEPLWGLRYRREFLHDGRAKSIEAAIELHAGEASGSRERYLQLSDQERATLLTFLRSL